MTDLATIPDLLFNTYDLRGIIENNARGLANEINSLSENEVLNTSPEDMVGYLIKKWGFDPLAINESGIQIDYGDAQVDVSGDFRRFLDSSKPFYVTGTRVTFYVPFTGDQALFKCQPSTYSLNPPIAAIMRDELVFTYDFASDATDHRTSRVRDAFQRDLENIQIHMKRVNADVNVFNSALPEEAKQKLNARREKLLQDRDLAASIGFPLRHSQNSPLTFVAPDVKRRITPKRPTASSEPFRPEPSLDADDYEYILSVLSNMATVMERSPRAFKNISEEDLRTHFLIPLNSHYEGQATGETFNYEGKTDILIRADGKNIFIAECKFWTGPAGITKAIDQLLGYTSWRDTKTALLIFNRDRNMSTVLGGITETVREHPNFKTERDSKSETDFRYVFGHRDDVNREVSVAILVFDVPM